MKRSIILIALFGALLSSPAWAWGVMGVAAGAPPPLGFADTFTGSNGDAPSTTYWSSLYTYSGAGANCTSGTYFNIQSNDLTSYSKITTGGNYCAHAYHTKDTLPVAAGRSISITSSNWSNVSIDGVDVALYLIDADYIANAEALTGFRNTILVKYYGIAHSFLAAAANSGGTVTQIGTTQTTASYTGEHTLKLYLNDSTHLTVYWDSTKIIDNASFSASGSLGSNVYAMIKVENDTTNWVTFAITGAEVR